MSKSSQPVYNRVVKVGLRVSRMKWLPAIYRYEATFYNSAYGMGWVQAFTERKCQQRYDRMRGEFYGGQW